MQREQVELVLGRYARQFFAFAMKRTSNASEAEELSQEIAYQVVAALRREERISKLDPYIWSVAHNTYKRWLRMQERRPLSLDEITEIHGFVIPDDSDPERVLIDREASSMLRRELSLLARDYRQVMVCYYCDGMSSRQIAEKLGMTPEMVRFYLMKAREKVREGIAMTREFGEKSYSPGEFHVYYSGIDWATINIWKLFRRKLPGSIVTTAYDRPVSVSDISIETGVPSVYLDDEIGILMDAGLVQEPARGRFQTSFFILKKGTSHRIADEFRHIVSGYVDKVEAMFVRALPHLKDLRVFHTEVPDIRYKWLFIQKQNILDVRYPPADEYPRILADGSRAFIWGQESPELEWGRGASPTDGDGYTICPLDIVKLGYRHQRNLSKKQKRDALYEIATGRLDDANKELYAELVAEGYAVREGDSLLCNIPVLTRESSAEIKRILGKASEAVGLSVPTERFISLVEGAIRKDFNQLVQGTPRAYAALIVGMNVEAWLLEAMYQKGYITLPEAGDNTPMTSYIELV